MAAGELDLENGAAESAKPKSKGGRPSNETKKADLAKELKESLLEVASILKEDQREQPDDLADIIRRDAEKIANFGVAVAEKVPFIESALRRLVGKSGPLYGARALGPTVRHVLGTVRDKREQYFGESELPEEPGGGQPGPDPYA